MKEISLNILDITQNSVAAGAKRIVLTVDSSNDSLRFSVEDNGCGMSEEMVANVTDPFTTTRTTRKVGLGIPLLQEATEQTGGGISIRSKVGEGTTIQANYKKNHIDCPPLGDMAETVSLLIQAMDDDVTFVYHRIGDRGEYQLSTEELHQILGEDISLKEPDVLLWIRDYVRENEAEIV